MHCSVKLDVQNVIDNAPVEKDTIYLLVKGRFMTLPGFFWGGRGGGRGRGKDFKLPV